MEDGKLKNLIGWLLFPAGIVVILVGAMAAHLSSYRAGELVGQSLVFMLMVALVSYLVRSKDRSLAANAGRNFWTGVIFLAVCLIVLAKGIVNISQERRDTAGIQKRLDQIVDAQDKVASGAADPQLSSAPLPSVQDGQTDMQKIGVLIERAAQRANNVNATYWKAVQDAQFATVIAPETLSSASRRAEAHSRVASVNSAIDAWERDMNNSAGENDHDFQQAGLSGPNLAEVRKGYQEGMQNTHRFIQSFVGVERSLMSVADEILTFADSAKPSFNAERKRIVFATQDSLNRYNELLTQIRKVASDEANLMGAQRDHVRKIRDSMKESPN
jgi:hypothetical protein